MLPLFTVPLLKPELTYVGYKPKGGQYKHVRLGFGQCEFSIARMIYGIHCKTFVTVEFTSC